MGYSIDLVICIDGTGSMQPIINTVQKRASTFRDICAQRIMKKWNQPIESLRVKAIVFRDFKADGKIAMQESRFFILSDNDIGKNEQVDFQSWINSIGPQGGDDEPENALQAIACALKSEWTNGGEGNRQVILMFTDAPFLELGERSKCRRYPKQIPQSFDQLQALWNKGTGKEIMAPAYDPSSGRLIIFAPAEIGWERVAGWERTWLVPTAEMGGCEDVDISRALDVLASSF